MTKKNVMELQRADSGKVLYRWGPSGVPWLKLNPFMMQPDHPHHLTIKTVHFHGFTPDGRSALLTKYLFEKDYLTHIAVVLLDIEGGTEQVLMKRPMTDQSLTELPVLHKGIGNHTFDTDGRYLAFSVMLTPGPRKLEKVIALWDLRQKAEIFRETIRLKGDEWYFHSDPVFSPDGKYLAAALNHQKNVIAVWDVATGKKLAALEGHTKLIRGFAFTPDGRQIVSVSKDKTLRIWDSQTGRQEKRINVDAEGTAVAVSPDGRRIVLLQLETLLSTLPGETCGIWVMQFRDVTTGRLLWDMSLSKVTLDEWRNRLRFSPDGQKLMLESEPTFVWDAATGERIEYRSNDAIEE